MINPLPGKAMSGNSIELAPSSRRPPGSSTEPRRPNINLVGSLKRHWFISLFVFLVLLGCGGFVLWKKVMPVYEAHSIVYVSPRFPKIVATNDNEAELPYESYFADQIQTVTRHDIIEDAVTKLPYSARHWSGPALRYEIQVLQQSLEVKRIGITYEMSIGLTGPSPNGLADIVNAVTDTYVEKAKNEEFFGLDSRLATLHQEQDRLQKQMDDRMGEQAQLMKELGVAKISSSEGATNPYDSTLQTVRGQLAAARMDRDAAEARYTAVSKGDGSGESTPIDAAVDEAITTDSGLSVTRSNLSSRRAMLTQEMNGLSSDHPVYQKDKEELASLDFQMNELRRTAAQHLQEKLREDVTRTRMVELQLISEVGAQTNAATSAAPKYLRAAELGPEIDSLQKAYDAIEDRIRELSLESSSPGSIHLSTRALTPLGPEKSKLRVFSFLVFFMSLTCAIALPIGIDLVDNRIYTPQDVEKVVGFHPLGILLNDDDFRQEISDEYYFRLAAGVDHAFRNSGVRTFLFTSSAHGSGTTTVVRKLNEELRGLNLRTRTITATGSDELDVSRSDVPSRFDHLLESRNRTDEIQSLPLAPLVAIYDGHGDPKRQEETASRAVVQILHHAAELCDVVLIDANPLPISAHTEYLARLADATVLVVKSGMTSKQELDRAARLLERLQANGVAVILNNMSRDRADGALKSELNRYEESFRHSATAAASREEVNTRI
jgi:polysaccharide biosynthesis transport protein